MRILILGLAIASTLRAEPPPLDTAVADIHLETMPVRAALRVLSRASGAVILCDPDVAGDVSLEASGGTLRSALTAITAPLGLHWEETSEGIAIRVRKTVLYRIDYPQLSRSGSGSASITLGGASSGAVGVNGTVAVQPAASMSGASDGNAVDATQISISQENPNTFWDGLGAELRVMLGEGDTLVLNRFSGVAQVTAPVRRQEIIRDFLALVNRRITRQVEIEARLVEVALADERKLGIDWDLAGASLGHGASADASAPLEVAGVGGAILSANSFVATIGYRQVTAVIRALKQQGEVKTVSQPRLRTLNNQSAVIKIGEDRPFFRLQQSTSFQQGGTTAPVNQTQENFSVSTITIGTILAVTPQIDDEGLITLDVLPAITRLQSVVTSPDGRQTAPVTEVKQASTIVRLRDGETAVIGGLISEEDGSTVRSVPGLGEAPLVGRAFRSRASQRTRTELVIFLTPRLVR